MNIISHKTVFNFVFIIAFFTFITLNGFAQGNNDINPFKIIYNGSNDFKNIVKIEFLNRNTKEVVNSFNLIEENPFNKLGFPEMKQTVKNTAAHNKWYLIDNVRLTDVKVQQQIYICHTCRVAL